MKIFSEGILKYYVDENGQKVYITDENGKKIYVTDKFIDIAYNSKQSMARVLSNLYPYQFKFRHKSMNSVEGLLQSLKHPDKATQSLIWKYAGVDAYHTRATSFIYDWRDKGELYWQGKSMNRFGMDYQQFIDEIYFTIYKENQLFKNALDYTYEKVLLHSLGELDPRETILTPDEYIDRLIIIRDKLAQKEKENKLNEVNWQRVKVYNNKEYCSKNK